MQNKVTFRTFFAASSIAAGLLLAAPAHAAAVLGGSALLAAGDADQLETWLGEGAITLTNIFTKQAGDDSYDFHAAVDGKGRTFVVMYGTVTDFDTGTEIGTSAVYGGYNPQSWNSSYAYNTTANVADRTGFLFNLSTDQRFAQRTTLFTGGPWAGSDSGLYQTYNGSSYGPTFGGGHDIFTDFTLNTGYSFLWSYTDDNAPTGSSKSIVDGGQSYSINISGIEVFTIGPGATTVPEPGSLALAGLALAGLAAVRRRRSASALAV